MNDLCDREDVCDGNGVLAGGELLAGARPARVLVLGVDLASRAPLEALLALVPRARVVSFTDREAPAGIERLPKTPLRARLALGAAPWDAVVAAQDYRNLLLFTFSLPAARRLVLDGGRLHPIGLAEVSRQERRRLGRWARHRWYELLTPPPVGAGNDYGFIAPRLERLAGPWRRRTCSVIVPVYDRRDVLEKTLAGLALQDYPRELFEVVVADDGSHDHPEEVVAAARRHLDVKIVRQEDHGYRLAAVRNLAIAAARGDVVASLDCDMLPAPGWLSAFMRWFHVYEGPLLLVGYRNFVSTDGLCAEEIRRDFGAVTRLPRVAAPSAVRNRLRPTRDWRLAEIERTDMLRRNRAPFALASGGNVAYRRADAVAAGLYDEGFERWGGEDAEFAYRLVRRGAYVVPEPAALAYHQDHPAPVDRERDRQESRRLLGRKVPYYRNYARGEPASAPKVSVYVPAYNAASWIRRAVDSALAQTLQDLEVCVCDDGSTDDTLAVLEAAYGGDPRVRFCSQPNRGIGAASNAAVGLCRGELILQLDADDELLPDAAEVLARRLDADPRLALAYGGYEVVVGGQRTKAHLPAPYSRYEHLLGNVVSHPRMFRARDFHRTTGFDESLANAVDYDLSLKLVEHGEAVALPRVLYRYYVHGGNTSVRAAALQAQNHRRVIAAALARRGLDWRLTVPDPEKPRAVVLTPREAWTTSLRRALRERRGR